ncbi:hypothetical protein BSU04_43075 [Caballeronia sordidicola]|uniref:Uncharacterized protein n=1 Tax=Caballeronia sordidicola TaxID=196367 RepID=A0A226WMR6_CABSO|nr:hypothetical protein BSU04_43075 [Caballeronia sordidicola]
MRSLADVAPHSMKLSDIVSPAVEKWDVASAASLFAFSRFCTLHP